MPTLLLLLLLTTTAAAAATPGDAVASDDPTCTEISMSVLRRSGSAVDAAVAALICVGLYMPQSMGLGGGFFMTMYNRKSGASVVDAREMAPLAASEDMFHGNANLSKTGPLSIAVPAQVKGLHLAHQMYGRLPWRELFEPSVSLCRQGINVTKNMAWVLQKGKATIKNDPGLRSVYVDPATGDVYKENDTLTLEALGNTLDAIGRYGPDALYRGELGRRLVDDVQAIGGILTMEDLANYTALHKNATVTTLSGNVTLFGAPPPAGGVLLSEMLLVLDGYGLNGSSFVGDGAVLHFHRAVETFKYTYAERAKMGDDQFADMSELVRNMTSTDFAAHVRSLISDNSTYDSAHYSAELFQADDGTSHLSVVSAEGDAVSITSTINTYFGSGIMSPSTGIILNDEMDDFSSPNITNYFDLPPSPANYIAPTKRPVSSACPSILVDGAGDVVLVTGAAGGTMIPTATALTVAFHLWVGDDLVVATDRPRLHHQLYPPTITYEKDIPQEVLRGLLDLGHNITAMDTVARVNSILRLSNGTTVVYCDRRSAADVK